MLLNRNIPNHKHKLIINDEESSSNKSQFIKFNPFLPSSCNDIILLKETLFYNYLLNQDKPKKRKETNFIECDKRVPENVIDFMLESSDKEENEQNTENISIICSDEESDECTNFEELRNMPLSLSVLNHLEMNNIPSTNCVKPKKFWMEKIGLEVYDDDSIENYSYLDPDEESLEIEELQDDVVIEENCRKYKVAMINEDKLILRLDKSDDESNFDASEGLALPVMSSSTINDDERALFDSIELESDEGDEDQVHDQLFQDIEKILDKDHHFLQIQTQSDAIDEGSQMCINDKQDNLHVGDVVWAKLRGYPYWPGWIQSFCEDGKTICVSWYGWGSDMISYINCNSVFPFDKYFYDKFDKKSRSNKYKQAISLAKQNVPCP